jgi:uncharacterized protein (DUF58 family)
VPRYLFFLITIFLLAAVLRVDFFFTVGYLFFILFVLSRAWVGRGLSQVRFERRFTPRAFAGDDVQVEVRLHNTGRLPLAWLQVHESLPVELIAPPFHEEVFSLAGGERRWFGYELYCRKRGVYVLGPMRAQTGDLLGIEPPRQAAVAAEALVVYPRVVSLEQVGLPTRSPLVALPARSPLFEDPARVAGVRDYEAGDSPRRMHWTASARAGRLLVKRFQPAIARETLVCLDMRREAYGLRQRPEASELAVVAAASLANHIIVRQRLPAGLLTEATDPLRDDGQRPVRFYYPPHGGRGHLMVLLEALARVQLAEASPLPDLLRSQKLHLAWGTTVLAISGSAGAELFEALAALRQAGCAVALVLVMPAAGASEARQRAAVLGVPMREIWRERDLEQWT